MKLDNVQNGRVAHLRSAPVPFSDVEFALADVELDGESFTSTSNLEDHVATRPVSPLVTEWVESGLDAVWLRGRLELLFNTRNRGFDDRCEKTLSDLNFVASLPIDNGSVQIPFRCNDYYGKSGLTFSNPPPAEALVKKIVVAFWDLVLAEPGSLREYDDKMIHLGCGVWMSFGVKDGSPWFEESDSEPGEQDEE